MTHSKAEKLHNQTDLCWWFHLNDQFQDNEANKLLKLHSLCIIPLSTTQFETYVIAEMMAGLHYFLLIFVSFYNIDNARYLTIYITVCTWKICEKYIFNIVNTLYKKLIKRRHWKDRNVELLSCPYLSWFQKSLITIFNQSE